MSHQFTSSLQEQDFETVKSENSQALEPIPHEPSTAMLATPSSPRDHEADDRDNDSALGSLRSGSSCTLPPSEFDFLFDHGRRYHDPDRYYLPNDEEELDRLELGRHVRWTFDFDV